MWVMDHMADPTLNDPPVAVQAAGARGPSFSPEQYAAVEAMGFPHDVCHLALKRANGNTERAAEWILSNMYSPRNCLTFHLMCCLMFFAWMISIVLLPLMP